MSRKLQREAFVILAETAFLLALLAVLGLPGRRPPKAEAAVSFAETLQPRAARPSARADEVPVGAEGFGIGRDVGSFGSPGWLVSGCRPGRRSE